MCTLLYPVKKLIKGYKVVAVNNTTGKYCSPAMGCRYISGKPVRTITRQKCLVESIKTDILAILKKEGLEKISRDPRAYREEGFRYNMVGKTSIFKRREDAKTFTSWHEILNPAKYYLKIIEAVVSVDVFVGRYEGQPIAAGKVLTWSPEEVDNYPPEVRYGINR